MAQVVYAFFCEDLRTEGSGQVTAVGLWGGGLLLPTLPAALKCLAFHAMIRGLPDGQTAFELTVRIPGQPEAKTEGLLPAPRQGSGGAVNMNVIAGPQLLAQAGEIRATLKLRCDPPIEHVVTLTVGLQPSTTPPPAPTK